MNTAKLTCPHCGELTAPRTKLKNPEDFNSPRIAVCMFCGGELPAAEQKKDTAAAQPASNSALTGLLGGDERERRFEMRKFQADRRFCRDCAEFISHPFASRCGKTGRIADPMADCPHFTAKPAEEETDDAK